MSSEICLGSRVADESSESGLPGLLGFRGILWLSSDYINEDSRARGTMEVTGASALATGSQVARTRSPQGTWHNEI
jgi:hypothetical protein